MANTRSTYGLIHDCPHATFPTVLVGVWFADGDKPATHYAEQQLGYERRPQVWVPTRDAWTLDTVRMVLHELRAFLPPSDNNPTAGVTAANRRPRGKQPAEPKPPTLESVELWVEARGWRAVINPARNEHYRKDKDGAFTPNPTGEWSEPMQAALRDLAARSPMPLAAIAPVSPADSKDAGVNYAPPTSRLHPSRRRADDYQSLDPETFEHVMQHMRNYLRVLGFNDDPQK